MGLHRMFHLLMSLLESIMCDFSDKSKEYSARVYDRENFCYDRPFRVSAFRLMTVVRDNNVFLIESERVFSIISNDTKQDITGNEAYSLDVHNGSLLLYGN